MDAMDLVRRLFAAANTANLDEIVRWYDQDATLDMVGTPNAGVVRGPEQVRQAWAGSLAGWYDVRRIAGIETGWGWVRADWVKDGQAGYAYFWIEGDRIRKHRSVTVPGPHVEVAPPRDPPGPAGRGPRRPVFGVGGVVFDAAGRVLLVKRLHEPLAGQWSLPGGRLEQGETLEAATARELVEETGLLVDVGPLVEVFDRILLDADGNVQYHFVIADYLCVVRGGELAARSDVSDVMWATTDEVTTYVATAKARDVITKARLMRASYEGVGI
jgi:ADP-ribose pyrophosphatase YjhB (NUDIX family)